MKIVAAILLSAAGGALAVFGGYDDAPGATLLGLLMVLGAIVLGIRLARQKQP